VGCIQWWDIVMLAMLLRVFWCRNFLTLCRVEETKNGARIWSCARDPEVGSFPWIYVRKAWGGFARECAQLCLRGVVVSAWVWGSLFFSNLYSTVWCTMDTCRLAIVQPKSLKIYKLYIWLTHTHSSIFVNRPKFIVMQMHASRLCFGPRFDLEFSVNVLLDLVFFNWNGSQCLELVCEFRFPSLKIHE
jgi:hypothetical protein